MMYEEERLTEADYLVAELNGISRKLARNRWDIGWSVERAITEPRGLNKGRWPKWRDLALSNGIKEGTFGARVRKGMSPEEAATKPPNKSRSKVDKWVWDKAKENGIPVSVVSVRIHNYHWDWEKACTKPVGKRGINQKAKRWDFCD